MMLQKNSITTSSDDISSFCRRFNVPKQLTVLVRKIFSDEDIHFILEWSEESTDENNYTQETLMRAYRRGLLSKTDDGMYCLSNFYSMLDVYVVSRQSEYDRLTEKEKHVLDDWYFKAYMDGLNQDKTLRPTGDRVLPLTETIAFIDRQERPIYLNYCDCRRLTGSCGLPTHTCITYRDGQNTFADRGLSERIDKEQAKMIVRKADKAGLMHTVNANGICNCCGDCCYLFRGQRQRQSYGFWPKSPYVVQFDKTVCINCGLCVKRCKLDVFKKEDSIYCDTTHCAGCGLCVDTCPAEALRLVDRRAAGER
ncbi:4Fe-4S binding protein [Pectinatus frisingensis]|uniref:4Fe-4S binding protein n=1 Tax=Pectinatus frisingensis TaxID=865 RepID=UPI0018C7AF01|nr:4Fe-4S binding protein [Pectinatus frisingensis]